MIRKGIVLAIVAFAVAFQLVLAVGIQADGQQLTEASEDIETPYEDVPWWQVGAMPVLIIASGIGGAIILVSLIVSFANLLVRKYREPF